MLGRKKAENPVFVLAPLPPVCDPGVSFHFSEYQFPLLKNGRVASEL